MLRAARRGRKGLARTIDTPPYRRRRRRASLNEINGYVYVLNSLMEANQKLVTEEFRGNEEPDVQERAAPT